MMELKENMIVHKEEAVHKLTYEGTIVATSATPWPTFPLSQPQPLPRHLRSTTPRLSQPHPSPPFSAAPTHSLFDQDDRRRHSLLDEDEQSRVLLTFDGDGHARWFAPQGAAMVHTTGSGDGSIEGFAYLRWRRTVEVGAAAVDVEAVTGETPELRQGGTSNV
ncbi:hypothetical protein R6Q59_015772 [Mikania micrantha]